MKQLILESQELIMQRLSKISGTSLILNKYLLFLLLIRPVQWWIRMLMIEKVKTMK